MDYKKKYKEALERAKEINNEQRAQPFNIMTRVFPELAESEDEKIRKELLNYLYDVHDDDEDRARWLAWLEKQDEKGIVLRDTFGYEEGRQKGQEEGIMLVLDNPQKYGLEKQGEQKPAWSVEDNRIVAEIHHALEACEHEWNSDMSKEKDWLESLGNRVQPQQEWREKDKEILEDIIKYGIHHMSLDGRDIMWLESLKNKCIPQPKQEWSEVDERCIKRRVRTLLLPYIFWNIIQF